MAQYNLNANFGLYWDKSQTLIPGKAPGPVMTATQTPPHYWYCVKWDLAPLLGKTIVDSNATTPYFYFGDSSNNTLNRVLTLDLPFDTSSNTMPPANSPQYSSVKLPPVLLGYGSFKAPGLIQAEYIVRAIRNGLAFDVKTEAYNAQSTVVLYTVESANKPYIIVEAVDGILVKAVNHSKVGFIKSDIDNTISWDAFTANESFGTANITGATLYLTNKSDNTVQQFAAAAPYTSVTIPANTIQEGFVYDYYVLFSSDNEYTDPYPTKVTLTTIDVAAVGTPTYPVGSYVSTNNPITFTWDYAASAGSVVQQSDLQYLLNGTWTTFATTGVGITEYTAPADFFLPGIINWRVRCYNENNQPGEWSAAAFVGAGSPAGAVILGVSNSNKPIVYWSSTGQTSFNVRIVQGGAVLYDSNEIGGAAQSYKIPMFLDNGSYSVEVRVNGSSQIWSDYTSYDFSIETTIADSVVLTGSAAGNSAVLSWTSGLALFEVLRDGVTIATNITEKTYTDYFAGLNNTYVVRGIDTNDNFVVSNSLFIATEIKAMLLTTRDFQGAPVNLNCRPSGNDEKTASHAQNGVENYFAGREFPVYSFGANSHSEYSITATFFTRAEYDALIQLYRQRRALVYRDYLGNRFNVVITQLSAGNNRERYQTDLTLLRVD